MTKLPQLTRRDTLMLTGAATLMTPAREGAKAAARRPTVILVHGAWHGGWCWDRVSHHLEAAGVRVLTPTLTGLGERAHLNQPVPSLDTHVMPSWRSGLRSNTSRMAPCCCLPSTSCRMGLPAC